MWCFLHRHKFINCCLRNKLLEIHYIKCSTWIKKMILIKNLWNWRSLFAISSFRENIIFVSSGVTLSLCVFSSIWKYDFMEIQNQNKKNIIKKNAKSLKCDRKKHQVTSIVSILIRKWLISPCMIHLGNRSDRIFACYLN